MTHISIHCEHCGKSYKVLFSSKRRILSYRISCAVCPHCQKPNNPTFYNLYKINWRCERCKVFAPWARKKGKICVACYFSDYRLLPKEKKYNLSNETKFAS